MNADIPHRILLVDDEQELLKVASRLIGSLGYAVDTAASGPAALVKLGSEDFDLVVLDMVMDEMDGVETLRRIRGIKPNQPVIILSAYAEPEMVEAVRALGILAYVRKPFNLGALSVAIRDALQGKSIVDVL
jgi:two-component system alkaline phosphatase synthesis response regulator PhoP